MFPFQLPSFYVLCHSIIEPSPEWALVTVPVPLQGEVKDVSGMSLGRYLIDISFLTCIRLSLGDPL